MNLGVGAGMAVGAIATVPLGDGATVLVGLGLGDAWVVKVGVSLGSGPGSGFGSDLGVAVSVVSGGRDGVGVTDVVAEGVCVASAGVGVGDGTVVAGPAQPTTRATSANNEQDTGRIRSFMTTLLRPFGNHVNRVGSRNYPGIRGATR